MTPLANERTIWTALNGLKLTTHRIRVTGEGNGQFVVTSIMLEHLVSCAARKTAYGALLVLAAIFFIGGLALTMGGNNVGPGPLMLGAILAAGLVVAYFASRQTVLVFASGGGASVRIQTGNMETSVITDTIDIVESTIDARRTAVAAAPPKNSRPPAERQEVPQRSTLPPAARERTYQVSRNGEDQGTLPVSTIKRLLSVGQLSLQDYYLDTVANEWLPLESLPDLV